VGRYPRLADARERGLVVAAMELPHWVVRDGREYTLRVEEVARERVFAALAEYESDERARPTARELEPLRVPKFALMILLLVMAACYRVQSGLSRELIECGVADDAAIRHGEWWRTFTALTLHGNTEHLVSNLSLAVFVFAFVLWRFGVGCGLLGIVLGGALGNGLNVFAHLSHPHLSLGSSTALFAGLGLLAGAEIFARLAHRGPQSGWRIIVPIGAGLAFLSIYGGGGAKPDGTTILDAGNVDVLAHLFGLLAGVALGAGFFAAGWKGGASARRQIAFGASAVLLLVVSWACAALR
jgi:membrane associated rhomboid family serine protease